MIVADTSAWIDYFNGVEADHVEILDNELLYNRVIICDLIIAELLQGFRTEKQLRIAKEIVERLEYVDFVGKEIAYKTAETYIILWKKWVTLRKTIDMIIGTFCIMHDIELIHNDKDYDPLEKYLGLKVKK